MSVLGAQIPHFDTHPHPATGSRAPTIRALLQEAAPALRQRFPPQGPLAQLVRAEDS